MPFVPFHSRFPDVAERESRTVTVFDRDPLPQDTYVFAESYCDEERCDCRRVFLNVFSKSGMAFLATISWGWESREFYREWMHGAADEEDLDELQGPALVRMTAQSPLAPALLGIFQEVVLDDAYAARLKRHYRMFRESVDRKEAHRPHGAGTPPPGAPGRNVPCPCGSGKKFKRCCGE
ncbi:MAG: SEC-C domain-containing protein [Planctomycetes bacterium]|nr:SEC-C domain-containing protein [Planctomycetota bacterium]